MFDTLRDNSRIIVYIVVVAFVISGGFMGYGAYLNNQGGGGQAPNQMQSVIAEVNGREISQQEYFTLLQQQAPQSNLNSTQIVPFRYNILAALIERKLILEQAENLDVNVEVSESEIDKNYNNILDQNGMSDQELADVLAEQGYTIGQLRDDIKSSIKESKTINETIEEGIPEINVTDQEIKELYEQRYPKENDELADSVDKEETDSESSEKERPTLADQKDSLETEIRNQKRNQAINNWLEELKESAIITINDPVLSAYHALENENYAQAVDEFSIFVEQEETDPIFYSYLAQAYEGQDNYEQAEKTYDKAIESFPENKNLKFNFAKFLRNQEKNEQAIEQLDKITAAAEDDFMTHYQLFILYSQLGAEEKAQSAIEKAQNISQNMQQNQQNMENENPENIEEDAEEIESDLEIEDPLEIKSDN